MDTTKTDALDTAATDPETQDSTRTQESTATAAADQDTAVPAQGSAEPDARDEDGFDEDGPDDEAAGTQGASGVLAAAGSVVAVGLGISSLTGTWIGDLMKDREQLIGQIKTSGRSVHEQLAAGYGTPWHTVALFNGIFALVAILVAAVVLFRPGRPAAAGNHWSQALAWGGLILGALGLLIAGVMWFDVFTDLPVVAATS